MTALRTMPTIDLIALTPLTEPWRHGSVVECDPTPAALSSALGGLTGQGSADAVLCWGAGSTPPLDLLCELLDGRGDLWSAGLSHGTAGLPRELHAVRPTWMLNADPMLGRTAVSWRLDLRCCLIRQRVARALDGPDATFETLAGAGLEYGLQALRAGFIPLHVSGLSSPELSPVIPPPVVDGLRLVGMHYGRMWSTWALLRALRHRRLPLGNGVRTHRLLSALPVWRAPDVERPAAPAPLGTDPTVTVLIPTIDRYPYLRKLLSQLCEQTVPPAEVVVVDQTPLDHRQRDVLEAAGDLPVRLLELDTPGQCSSRNLGIERSSGECILFLDDDDEVGPDLIERHLRHLAISGADASCGVVEEVGSPPTAPGDRRRMVSSEFPTNNVMLRREALRRSRLFDLAFDRGARADADLGMRLYRSGALLLVDPDITLLHHHAPRGGLRTHGARAITRASSRQTYTVRHLRATTEQYLNRKYFSQEQVQEDQVLCALSSLSRDGTRLQRAVRLVIATLLLPDTFRRLRASSRDAEQMFDSYPVEPELPA